jgi:hypothetical protein
MHLFHVCITHCVLSGGGAYLLETNNMSLGCEAYFGQIRHCPDHVAGNERHRARASPRTRRRIPLPFPLLPNKILGNGLTDTPMTTVVLSCHYGSVS